MNKKRVFCFILPSFFFERKGGAEIQCYYIAQELINIGWEVHYIRETDKPFLKETVYDGIKLHSVYNNRILKRFHFLQTIVRQYYLRKKMDRINADYWYIRSDDTYLPFVNNIRQKNESELIWACAHDFKVEKNYWEKRFGVSVQNEIIKSLVDATIVFQTEYQRKTFKANYGMFGSVVYNSHPVPRFSIKKEQTIVWLSNLKELKRPELFIELAKKMKKSNYNLIMIGKDYKHKYLKILNETEIECNNFQYLGELAPQEIHKILEKAKVLVNTSRVEGFSNTFIEAWLRGIPVFTVEVDPDNLIKKHNLGEVCSDLDILRKHICELLENPNKFIDLSEHIYKFAVEHFDIKKNTKRLLECIEKRK